MVKNKPVNNWITKHIPNNEPKFHIVEILLGVGRSSKELLIIFISLLVFILE